MDQCCEGAVEQLEEGEDVSAVGPAAVRCSAVAPAAVRCYVTAPAAVSCYVTAPY